MNLPDRVRQEIRLAQKEILKVMLRPFLDPVIGRVRNGLIGGRKRPSRGYAKHVRRLKSGQVR
jgi:hypothetical protein